LPVAEIPEPLEIEIWRETLSYFARATGLTLALFDAAGAMRTGPLGANPLTEMLVRAGTWHEPDGLCFAAAREVTRRCVEKAAPAQTVLHGILAIVAVPLREKGQMLGAIAAGWVFTNFPEPISSDRFARTLGLSFPELWQIVRQVAPMTAEKLAHYADLLQMVADLFIKHRADTAEKFALIHDLQTQRAELERAGHARDRLFAVVSHELRTPLTPILGWMPIIREELAAGRIEPLREAFEAVERNARQEAHLIDEMLDLSRILTDRIVFAPEHVAPAVAVAETASLAQSLVRERTLAIRTDLTERLPTVWIDRKRLLQILGNLVSNAVKFTPDGGSITIGARAPASDVEFFVADTGIGVEAGSLELIFDRFQQADEGIARRFGGLGIGLSVVKSLVEMQGGRVRVESPGKNRGATFILTFPAAQNALLRSETSRALPLPLSPASPGPGTSAAAPPPPADMPRWRGAFRVLLVDDNADTLQILRRLLVRAGYEIVIASSARDALAMAKGLKPDALVTDLGMPECDGLELLRQLRAEPGLASLPAIAASGFAGQTEQAAAHVAGFNAYFIKPLDIPLLIDTLDELLRTARPAAPAGAIDASENE
jgi:signal transduction histidine kinase/ActR/RegA family two-component response regulator